LVEQGRGVRELKHLAKTMRLRVDQITVDPTIQSRTALDEPTVEEYAEQYEAGASLPALEVVKVGARYVLYDGYHRHAALLRAGRIDVDALVLEGTEDEARLYSAGANTDHGLRRTQADKQRAVEIASANPLSAGWTNQRLAAWCGVSDKSAAKWRRRSGEPDAKVTHVPESGRTVQRKARTARAARSDKAAAATRVAAGPPNPEIDTPAAVAAGGQRSPAVAGSPFPSGGPMPQAANPPADLAPSPSPPSGSAVGVAPVGLDRQPPGGGPTAAAAAVAERLEFLACGLGRTNFDTLAGVVRSDERARANARELVPLLRRTATCLEDAMGGLTQ